MAYTGLDERLKRQVFERDNYRCRWCGVTNQGVDVHHIEYRRGYSFDRLDNLVTLCRAHHSFVHGIPNGARQTIVKSTAQQVLKQVIERPGSVGNQVWRRLKREWVLEGRCETHGAKADECLECA